jgi:hypothetical protein
MRARIMISSVTKDELPLGNLKQLSSIWIDASTLRNRLVENQAVDRARFSAIRKEIKDHLVAKYGFDAYIFEETPGPGRAPEAETILEARHAHLVIGVFGSKTGWTVGDQDPLTPTLREWRAALEQALKFRLFWMKGSVSPSVVPGELGSVLQQLTNYKSGKVFVEFASVADLFLKLDSAVQDYLNTAVTRYAREVVAKEPNAESETWLLGSYRKRVELMQAALGRVAAELGFTNKALKIGHHRQPVSLHSVPAGFGDPDAKKFVAYVFDDESTGRQRKSPGKLAIISCLGNITDGQIRRHFGNIESSEVYSGSWGFYAADPISGRQALYLPRCSNSLRMEVALSEALTWLHLHEKDVSALSILRQRILDAGQ